MSSRPAADGAPFDVILEAVREHTHQLLGATIGFTEEHWAQPSLLPGWTHSHVAAHVVENARGFIRVCRGMSLHRPARMYVSHSEKVRAVEEGALAGGLQLQIDLDTSASELQTLLPPLEGNLTPLELRPGYRLPAEQIPLARLYEVVIHSVDLGMDGERSHFCSGIPELLLAFEAERIGRRPDLPGMLILADEGYRARLGADDDFTTVGGPAIDLLLWLARGISSPHLRGAWDRSMGN
ncbi:MAG: maleylpyruvate isomerase family mycothiol-dependent enzyme [Arachnia sp.]